LGRNSWKQKLRRSKEGEEEAMAMKKRNEERYRKGKERKENQTVFCNGHCGQQKLPLQLNGGARDGAAESFDFIYIIIYFPFLKNRPLFGRRA
jgi:hypothetical protein